MTMTTNVLSLDQALNFSLANISVTINWILHSGPSFKFHLETSSEFSWVHPRLHSKFYKTTWKKRKSWKISIFTWERRFPVCCTDHLPVWKRRERSIARRPEKRRTEEAADVFLSLGAGRVRHRYKLFLSGVVTPVADPEFPRIPSLSNLCNFCIKCYFSL